MNQSQIANFLDLIKHITQTKNFKSNSLQSKSKRKSRYNEVQSDDNLQQIKIKYTRKQLSQSNNHQINKNQTKFDHKMLKISHDIKHRQKMYKIRSFYDEKGQTFSDLQNNELNTRNRSNLYQNYCQMIQKKRQQKIKKLFRDSQPDIGHNICNISDIAQFDNEEANRRNSSIFKKSKSLKPGLESIKVKNGEKQKSTTTKMPQQLYIQTMKTVKLKIPKIISPSIANKRKQFKAEKLQYSFASPRAKKIAFNKIGSLQGWQYQEEKSGFNFDFV